MRMSVMLAAAGTALFASSGMLRRSVGGALAWAGRERHSIDELRSLDDHALADIGFDRGSLGFALCKGSLPQQDEPRHRVGPPVGDA